MSDKVNYEMVKAAADILDKPATPQPKFLIINQQEADHFGIKDGEERNGCTIHVLSGFAGTLQGGSEVLKANREDDSQE